MLCPRLRGARRSFALLLRRRCGLLADHRLRVLVVAKALEGGGSQGAGLRPLEELDLGHQLRLHEDRALLRLAALERRAIPLEWLEQFAEAHEVLLLEARADVSDVDQPVAVVDAHDERAEALSAPALARHPAADHDLLALDVLDLQPVAAALARLVDAVELLGDHPFEAVLPAGLEKALAVAGVVGGRAPAGPLQLQI